MSSIEESLLADHPSRDQFGNPRKGTVQTIVLNNTHDGWVCMIQYWFVARWNEASGADPAECLRKALAMKPDYAPLPATTAPVLAAAIAERCGEKVEPEDDGLLV